MLRSVVSWSRNVAVTRAQLRGFVSTSEVSPALHTAAKKNLVEMDEDFLTLRFGDERPEKFSLLWLRDHCRCPACYSVDTFQREYDVKLLSKKLNPHQVSVDGQTLHIHWDDEHKSGFGLQWLQENSYSGYSTRLKSAYQKRKPWTGKQFKDIPIARIPVEEVVSVNSTQARRAALESLWNYGVVFIENVAANVPATRRAVESLAPLMKTMWGEDPHVFEANEARSDSAYSMQYIGAHTDNTYFTEAAGLLGLACYSHDGTGGENSLVDGLTVINQFKAICPDGFDFFSKHAIPSEFREERENRRHHFHSTDYVLKSDPTTGDFVQIRYNVYDRAPMSNLPPDMAAEFYAHYQKLGEIIEEHEKDNWFKLGSGSLVLFDNFRVLHARQAFTGRRVMVSAYVSRGEFLSGARSLGVIP